MIGRFPLATLVGTALAGIAMNACGEGDTTMGKGPGVPVGSGATTSGSTSPATGGAVSTGSAGASGGAGGASQSSSTGRGGASGSAGGGQSSSAGGRAGSSGGGGGSAGGADAGGSADAGSPVTPMPCDTAFVYQGLNGCITIVEGITVKFFPLDVGQRVNNLAVYLHMDTAPEWYSNSAFPVVTRWGKSKGLLVVAPLATSLADDGTPAYGSADTIDTVNRLGPVLEKFRDAYHASADRIFYWAGSGGSWFIPFWFIPQMGKRLPGIFVPSCGGTVSQPYEPWAWDPARDTATRDKIAILFNYGSSDFLASYIEEGIAEYKMKGFDVTSIVYPGAIHCVHPIDQPTIDFWSMHL